MRPLIGTCILIALLLQACALTGGDERPDTLETDTSPPAYMPKAGLSDKERFREALNLLEEGEPESARAELEVYLQAQPNSDVARDLMRQIDRPPEEYFPADYREIVLRSGWSLSTVSREYLGSVYKFHALAKYNGISEPRKLSAGQTIRVPLTPEALRTFETGIAAEAPEVDAAATPPVVEGPPDDVTEDDVTEDDEAAPDSVSPAEDALATGAPDASGADDVQPVVSGGGAVAAVKPSGARVQALHRQALDAYRAQKLDRAIELWDEVLALDPDFESARLYRSQAIELREKLSNLL